MRSAGRGLDEVVDLLGRWGGAAGPADRLQVVTEAARVLRDLPSTDSRVLARQLVEHGAPNAAQKIAQQTGGAVSADQLNDAAYALLSVDRDELDGLARELRDPEERRRIVEAAGVALRDAAGSAPPPAPEGRLAIPPPPGAQPPDGTDPRPAGVDPGDDAGLGDAGPGDAGPGDAGPGDAGPDDPDPGGTDADPGGEGDRPAAASLSPAVAGSPASPKTAAAPFRSSSGAGVAPTSRFVDDLAAASNGRERLTLLDEHHLRLDHRQLIQVLQAVPDGWQRRTVLRRLLATHRIEPLNNASDVVAAFTRRGDRFAAAASLTRSGIADVVPLLAHLDPADARRLRRRYTT